MTKAISKTYSIVEDSQAYLNYALIAGCLFMGLWYASNMYSAVKATVGSKEIEKETVALRNSVQSLEAQYITLSNKITPETAENYGLHEGIVSEYIPRSTSLGSAIGVRKDL